MRYTVTGRILGFQRQFTWEDGQLSGDFEPVNAIQILIKDTYGERLPYPWCTSIDHNNPTDVFQLAKDFVFDKIDDVEGDEPIPDWEKGMAEK